MPSWSTMGTADMPRSENICTTSKTGVERDAGTYLDECLVAFVAWKGALAGVDFGVPREIALARETLRALLAPVRGR